MKFHHRNPKYRHFWWTVLKLTVGFLIRTNCTWFFWDIYTQTKVKQHKIFFGDTVLEVAEGNMWVMEIKYFDFYCKFYYFYEHLELQMILSTKYLDISRPFTKQVKNDKEKQWKKFEADVWKIFFGLTFNDVVWWGFDRKCHRYLLVWLWTFPFFWRTDWKCIKCDVLGK